MDFLSENLMLLLAIEDLPTPIWLKIIAYIVLGVIVVGGIYFGLKMTANKTYDLTGSYGGGGGLSRIFRHKRLKKYDREMITRGRVISFEDRELERMLIEGNLKDASKYLTGILNAAKESGDKHTMRKYQDYFEELIEKYEELEQETRGGKAIHSTK